MHKKTVKHTYFPSVFLESFIQNMCLQFFCGFENLEVLCVVCDLQFD